MSLKEQAKKITFIAKPVRKILQLFRKSELKRSAAQVDAIPRWKIRKEHVKDARLLLDRETLLAHLPQNGIVAELGVDEGNFSNKIIKINNPKKLHLIDIWGSERFGEDKAVSVKDRFSAEIRDGRIVIHRALSIEAAMSFEDGYFDWIYIDTAHNYKTTIDELRSYASKVKKNGVIAGHDYAMGNWRKRFKYGVIEAVAQFCVEEDWRIEALTADYTEGNSFAIRRI